MPNDDLQLLHNFIHDLKAPLSSAKSFVDLLVARGGLTKEQEHFAFRAQSSMDKMNRIILALLEYARLEAGMALDVKVVDLLEAVEYAIDGIEGGATERQITIDIDIKEHAQFVQADEDLLDSVLTNLIANAIKYNRVSGNITVSSEDAGEFVRIRVQDTGFGIPDDAIEHIFKQFYRVETKEHMSIEGTGIGLSMVKSVIEKHGGEIGVDSVYGEGTTFYFTLLRASASSPDYDREPTDGLDDRFQESRHKLDDTDTGEAPR